MLAADDPPSQDQVSDVVMEEGLSGTTGGKTAVNLDFSVSSEVKRLKSMLKRFSALVLTGNINLLIARAVNKSFFIVLGGNFNEDSSHKSASFKKCSDLGLINSLGGSLFAKMPIAVVDHDIANIGDHFDSDHRAVSKFDIKNADEAKWLEFKSAMSANTSMFTNKFDVAVRFSDLDAISIFTKATFRFHKLKLLVSKLVKTLHLNILDFVSTSAVKALFLSDSNFNTIYFVLAKARKLYHFSKLLESKCAEEYFIKQAINKRMESFELDKVLKSILVKSKVNVIMKKWTRKCRVHCDKLVLDMLLLLLNFCLIGESEGVLMNTHLIALIETACKILFKMLLDKISLACSTFDVLCEDNFFVLKNMSTQSPIFTIGSVIENALEKNRELWMVLQNICKAYDSVGWEHLKRNLVRIKMYNRFIRFFGSIHNGHTNRVMTDFGLTDGYCVYDRLDQREVFSPLLWCIFYNPLLCEVKRQESVCGYRLDSYFISKTGRVESQIGLMSFFTAGAFAAMQHILNIASEFYRINDIFINNNKTMAIFINCTVSNSYLTISGLLISVAKKKEPHHYFGIFLSSKSLSKPSLAKAKSDVQFFVNLVLKKAISDKQFVYLVSVVFFLIVNYCTQFSFISDTLICKSLKFKSGLPLNFPIQTENKSASIVSFANSVLSWHPYYSLQFPVCIRVCLLDNFLAGVICIFSECNLSLGSLLAGAFYLHSSTPMYLVLGEHYFFKCVSSLRHYEITFKIFKRWKQMDLRGPILVWFKISVCFLNGLVSSFDGPPLLDGLAFSDIRHFHVFGIVGENLLQASIVHLSVYMDGSLSGLDTSDMRADMAVYFEDVNLGIGVGVSGLVFSTMAELQAITLALKCVPFSYSIDLFSDSQTALDAYKSESLLISPDFRNQFLSNKYADALTEAAAFLDWCLLHRISNHFLKANGVVVSSNSRHFVHDVGSGSRVVAENAHLAVGFTNAQTANFCTYFMKALHHQLLVVMQKWQYNNCVQLMAIYASAWEVCSVGVIRLLGIANVFGVSFGFYKPFISSDTPIFVIIELASTSANSFNAGTTGLGIYLNTKKKCVNTVYSHSTFYKKLKVPVTSGVVDLSASFLNLKNIGIVGVKSVVF
ncbi:hypothetical protein G9A89_019529 [Geosiphon pyriformis]|nr:hypothetical protein G9A89_019529 [Geosiphon pyriformis]